MWELGVDKKEGEINPLNYEQSSSQHPPASETHAKDGCVPNHWCPKETKNEPTPCMTGESKAPMRRRAKCIASQQLDSGRVAQNKAFLRWNSKAEFGRCVRRFSCNALLYDGKNNVLEKYQT